MGLACSPDIYQEKMSELFIDMIFIIVYQDNMLVLTSSSFDNHQQAPLVYFKGKIMIPTNLCSCVLTWYHENLLHPGTDQMFHTISQHFTWPSLRTQVEDFMKH
jgi:hypothetical protein